MKHFMTLAVAAALVSGSAMARDLFKEGDKELGKGHKRAPLLVKVDDQGNHQVYASDALTPEKVQELRTARNDDQKKALFDALVNDVDAAANEVEGAKLAFDRKADFKDEVAGQTAWWWYGYGWSFYHVRWVYTPVVYYYYPRVRYTYWVIW